MLSLSYWKRWVASGGLVALAAFAATPAHAADYATSCSAAGVQWTPVDQITLGPETDSLTGIWGTYVTITVDCKDNGTTLPLKGAVFAVGAYSKSITDLRVTIDGSDPTFAPQPLPVAQYDPSGLFVTNAPLMLGSGLQSDADGHVTFHMRASSQSQPALSPDGSSTEIGLHTEISYGTPNGNGGWTSIFMRDDAQLFAATPELDSLALFGTGAAGMVGYSLMRLRARRRR